MCILENAATLKSKNVEFQISSNIKNAMHKSIHNGISQKRSEKDGYEYQFFRSIYTFITTSRYYQQTKNI